MEKPPSLYICMRPINEQFTVYQQTFAPFAPPWLNNIQQQKHFERIAYRIQTYKHTFVSGPAYIRLI